MRYCNKKTGSVKITGSERAVMSCVIERYPELSSCHEDNEKKRCPECLSLHCKKKGFLYKNLRTLRGSVKHKLQRYYCHSCGISFTSQGYQKRSPHSKTQEQKAVLDYVSTTSTLREVSYRFNVSHQTILNWMMKHREIGLGDGHSLPKTWSGYISFDGKETTVKGKKRTLLFALDSYSGYPFEYQVSLRENTEATQNLLDKVKTSYPVAIEGITTDFGRGKCFVKPIEEAFPGVPHQICLVHYLRYVNLFVPRTKRSAFYWRNAVLKGLIRRTVYAGNNTESNYWLAQFLHFAPFFRASYHKRYLNSLKKNHALLTAYYQDEDLPKTTNVSENFNRQLERKLKTMDGFKSDESIVAFINIWVTCYRMKKLNINRNLWAKYLWKS